MHAALRVASIIALHCASVMAIGFFDQHVFAMGRCHGDMFCVELVRRGDVDQIDGGVCAQGFDVVVAGGAKIAFELAPGCRQGISGGDKPHPCIAGERGQHQCECTAESGDTYAQGMLFAGDLPNAGQVAWISVAGSTHRSSTSSPPRARDTQTMMFVLFSSSRSTMSRCSTSPLTRPVRQEPQVPLSQELVTWWPQPRKFLQDALLGRHHDGVARALQVDRKRFVGLPRRWRPHRNSRSGWFGWPVPGHVGNGVHQSARPAAVDVCFAGGLEYRPGS